MRSSRQPSVPLDRRNCDRISCNKPIRVFPVSRQQTHSFTLMSFDMSVDGLFLSTEILLDVGEWLDVEYTVPGRAAPVRRTGQVVRADAGVEPGIALQLL